MSKNVAQNEDVKHLGIGIDTARYGHCAAFLRDDKNPAANLLEFRESGDGYRKFQRKIEQLHRRYPQAQIHVRIDAAGQYSANLECFVRSIRQPQLCVSVGEPKRNKDYHRAHSPKRKADSTESRAMARYAVVERPQPTPSTPKECLALKRVASRLRSQVKQTSRLNNQLHETLSAVFPELATLVAEIKTGWVLKMLKKYPTAEKIASARALDKIEHLTADKAQRIQAAAQDSVASLAGEVAGIDKFGRPHPAGKKRMCRKGNDLVRGLLFNCAKSAAQEHGGNPAVRKLYLRLIGKGVRKDVAFGYCMTKRAPIADRRIGRTKCSASGPRARPSIPTTKRNEKPPDKLR